MKDDNVYLNHMLDSVEKIERYTASRTYGDFLGDSLLQDGVIRQLQILGDACKMLSEDSKSKNPGIPWRKVSRMRDKLVHQYFGVNLKDVWDTVESDIPELKKVLEGMAVSNKEFKALREKTAKYAAKKKISHGTLRKR
jgi:uncharacterized protein with HEPN domain